MPATRAFLRLELTERFDKSFRRLTTERQRQCEESLRQLIEAPIVPGLHLKPIRPSKKYWEARINHGDRLILLPVGAVAYVLDVVTHDEIAKWEK